MSNHMTTSQASAAVQLLNAYAHYYLGLANDAVMISAASAPGRGWTLIVATPHAATEAADFDAAKALLDDMAQGARATAEARAGPGSTGPDGSGPRGGPRPRETDPQMVAALVESLNTILANESVVFLSNADFLCFAAAWRDMTGQVLADELEDAGDG